MVGQLVVLLARMLLELAGGSVVDRFILCCH